MSRIGVIGGTFDPPHRGHLEMAKTTIVSLAVETVLFMPAPRPPHKSTDTMTPFERRVQMVELAIAGQKGFELSRMESEGEGASYTVDLLRRCRERALPTLISSDAHTTTHVTRDFDRAAEWLTAAGYDEVARFRSRKRWLEPLEIACA